MGGMFGESKFQVLQKVPKKLVPKSIIVKRPASPESVLELLQNNFALPVIFKPDLGERGFMVKRIENADDVCQYLEMMKHDFIIQQFVDLPLEFGVFYKRLPNEKSGIVTSIVMKEMLHVIGDGKSTLQQLILNNDRAKLQWETLKSTYDGRLNEVITDKKKLEIVSIGNHCLGTKFLNGNHLINEKLNASFDSISKEVDGFYFGRFDLRCKTIDDLQNGNVMVLELNGCGAEPAHIYDPAFPLSKGVGTLIDHWHSIFEIAIQNRRRGYAFINLKEAIHYYRLFKMKVKQ